jgi:hypothetical protein
VTVAHRDRGFAYRCRRWGLRERERPTELIVPAAVAQAHLLVIDSRARPRARRPSTADTSACNCLLFDPHGRLLHLDTTSSEVTQFTVR